MARKSMVRPRGNFMMELLRKGQHAVIGVIVVLLVQADLLSHELLGLITLVLGAMILFNYNYEKELLHRLLSINRADAKIAGLDLLAYFLGMWLVLVLFPREVAFAAIMVTAFGDPLAHLVSRGFGGTKTMVSRDSYWYGIVAGTAGGTIAAWQFVSFWPAFAASAIAMFVEAGEFRIADHYIDDNLTIPLVSAIVVWAFLYAV